MKTSVLASRTMCFTIVSHHASSTFLDPRQSRPPQPSSPHRRSDVLSESMTHEEGMAWLASHGGFLKHTLTREGVEQVMASAHGRATCTVVKDLSHAAEVWPFQHAA